jgi:integrase/recombinase XerD
MGRRDYAILLLLARLGLRAGEVASLGLNDIDWSVGKLSVCGKGGRRCELPLSSEVGAAIAAYLRQGRPQCTDRRVFLRTKAPARAFQGSSAVGTIVKRRLKRARITAPTYGTHQFRHGLASDMLREGASLVEIGAVLGHHHPDTTRIYTKIDLKALHTLAQPWPGAQ